MGYGVKWCFLSFANGESWWVSDFFFKDTCIFGGVDESMLYFGINFFPLTILWYCGQDKFHLSSRQALSLEFWVRQALVPYHKVWRP